MASVLVAILIPKLAFKTEALSCTKVNVEELIWEVKSVKAAPS
jgi:hypothetical protein